MAITLPLANQKWARFRLLIRAGWNGDPATPQTSGGGAWQVWSLEGTASYAHRAGFYLIGYERSCLPMIGTASFGFHYGKIDGKILAASSGSSSRAAAGSSWSTATDTLTIPDFDGFDVRIQAAPAGTTDWRTVWVGEVQTHDDSGWPAASVPAGDRVYHCADSLFKASRWKLDRHGYAAVDGSTTTLNGNLRGHPGFNVGRHHTGRTAGNRWTDADTWTPDGGGSAFYHTWPGSAGAGDWSDQQTIEHAQAATRRPQEPRFPLVNVTGDWDGSACVIDLLQGASPWAIRPDESCLDLMLRVLKRERAKGLAFLDWNDDSSAPDGPLTVFLRVWPQMYDDVTYTDPTTTAGTQITILGSYNAGTNSGNIDLIGDHRLVDDSFKLGEKDQHRLDALETVGEPIEVLITPAYQDGQTGSTPNQEGHALHRRWSATEQTAFRAQGTAAKRTDERWRPVYQLHGIPFGWDFKVGDGDNSFSFMPRCDYRCRGTDNTGTGINGSVFEPGTRALIDGTTDEETSPLMCELMDDLPLYEGWDYRTATPVRWDGQSERGSPQRRRPMTLLRVSSGKFLKAEETQVNVHLSIDGLDIFAHSEAHGGDGLRLISDKTLSHLGALYNYSQIAFTVGLRLPHRVRFYSGRPPTDPDCKRKQTIVQRDHHLWLAHPGAIWDIDSTTGSATLGHSPRRGAAGATLEAPGVLRDDRLALARLHFLAWAWYGTPRRTATWAIRACGSLGTFQAHQGSALPTDGSSPSTISYARLGQVVDQLSANGEIHAIKTPVTRIAYDNLTGTTTWSTDWNEMEIES